MKRCKCSLKPYVRFTEKFRWFIFIPWLLLTGYGGWATPKFISVTNNDPVKDPESTSAIAEAAVSEYFPSSSETENFIIFLWSDSGSVMSDPSALTEFSYNIAKELSMYNSTHSNASMSSVDSIYGYQFLMDVGFPKSSAMTFVSPDESGTIIPIRMTKAMLDADEDMSEFVDFIDELTANQTAIIQEQYPGMSLEAEVIGYPAFMKIVQESVEVDMATGDGISLPLAFLVVGFVLHSARSVLIIGVCIAFSAATAFGMMYPIAMQIHVMAGTLSLMMSILIALNIDYGLFLLSRFREAVQHEPGIPLNRAIHTMLSSAGHTVLVSGGTLALSFLGLTIVPVDIFRAVGIGCAMAVVCTLLANLTVVPAALFAFGCFRAGLETPCCGPCRPCRKSKKAEANEEEMEREVESEPPAKASKKTSNKKRGQGKELSSSPSSSLSTSPSYSSLTPEPEPDTSDESEEEEEESGEESEDEESSRSTSQSHSQNSSSSSSSVYSSEDERPEEELFGCWVRLGRFVTKPKWAWLIAVLCVATAIPFGYPALTFHFTNSASCALPRNAEITAAWEEMGASFGYGFLRPYQLMLVSKDPNAQPLDPDFWATTQLLLADFCELGNTNCSGILGPSYSNCSAIPLAFVQACITEASPLYNSSDCLAMRFSLAGSVSTVGPALLFTIQLSVDPDGWDGYVWYSDAVDVLSQLGEQYNLTTELTGGAGWDAADKALRYFPLMASVTGVIVLVVVGLAFRSILIPIRALLSIVITLIVAYGLSTLIFQYGILKWAWYGLRPQGGAIHWMPPLVDFSILVPLSTIFLDPPLTAQVGLCLDYELFILVRVFEYYDMGYDTSEAIVRALDKTGGVVTAAGCIMAIAFAGMLFSQAPILNQLAIYLVLAVLYDTFVVRSLLVPSVMSLFGRANWWPHKQRNSTASK